MDHLLPVAAVLALAGFCKGVVGLGLPAVSIGLLALVMTPAQAAALVILPGLLTNLAQLRGPALGRLLRRLWPLLLAMAPGAVAGSFVMAAGSAALPLLGAALVLYAGWGLAGRTLRLSDRAERIGAAPVGLAAGVMAGATGVPMIPLAPWLGALGLTRDELVQALGLCFVAGTSLLALTLLWQGALGRDLALASLLAVAPALAGQAVGARLRGRLSPVLFRRVFFVALLLLGAQLVWRGLA